MFKIKMQERIQKMRLCLKGWAALAVLMALLAWPAAADATSCTTQAEMVGMDRDALTAAGGRLSVAVAEQDLAALKAALLPAVADDWDGIRQTAEDGAVLMKGGQVQLRALYLLDAGSLTAPADTQFFCSNTSGTMTVTLNMRALPPGRYGVVLADAIGAPNAGQLGMLLAWDSGASGWKLGGLSARPGPLTGRMASGGGRGRGNWPGRPGWPAWFAYDVARSLLVPVDFLSSPNLEKLGASNWRSRTLRRMPSR